MEIRIETDKGGEKIRKPKNQKKHTRARAEENADPLLGSTCFFLRSFPLSLSDTWPDNMFRRNVWFDTILFCFCWFDLVSVSL